MNKVNRLMNGLSFIVNSVFTAGNEYLQILAHEHTIDYQSFMGYVGDITAPAALTSYNLMIFGDRKGVKYFPIFYASMFTIGEIAEKFSDIPINGGTYDPNDIACYWLGAGLAYGIHKITSTKPMLEERVSFNCGSSSYYQQ